MTENSHQDPTQTGEIGPMPTPQVEPTEPNPGGPDSVPVPPEVIAADLDPDKNPAVDDSPAPVKDTLQQAEDTDTEATRSDGSADSTGDAGKVESTD